MSDEKNLQAETYREKQRIKTHYARVIVGSNPDKPYYGIEYYNPTDGEYQEGFGSYDLKNVLRWLEEEFEIVEQTDHENALEAAKVIRAYCDSLGNSCDNCVFLKSIDKYRSGCVLDDVDCLPAEWNLEEAERKCHDSGKSNWSIG